VYPELVVRDATTGRIDGVRYEELAPMLLNEVQKLTAQVQKNAAQEQQNTAQASKIRALEQQVAEMHAALLKLQAKDERVAQR
jgi:molecular chaperone GrpE (heat shock protein)